MHCFRLSACKIRTKTSIMAITSRRFCIHTMEEPWRAEGGGRRVILARSARFRTYHKDLTNISTYLLKPPIYIEREKPKIDWGAEKGTLLTVVFILLIRLLAPHCWTCLYNDTNIQKSYTAILHPRVLVGLLSLG